MSSNKETMSLRLPAELKNKLELLAEATGRNKSVLAIEALDKYLEAESWQIKEIQEGLKQANEGMFISHEDVKAKWQKKAQKNAQN